MEGGGTTVLWVHSLLENLKHKSRKGHGKGKHGHASAPGLSHGGLREGGSLIPYLVV